ncbi:glycosyltransferase [Paenibacillus xylaniclasticus]|uniref:glycosyltransferase n=1 Tax=Paenibacillus xylaniclasticus TaxID=588083 RepID=UPI000FD7EB07|nr:glycosyltransferase [Paenibacillus xylaniclasticus]
MSVDIVIPIYNQGAALQRVLDGFEKQVTSYRYQVIVVDDGSTEDIESIVSSFSDKILYVYQENKGRAAARNKGVLEGNGEYIIFCDGDRIPGPKFIEEHLSTLSNNEDLVVIGCPKEIFKHDNYNEVRAIVEQDLTSAKLTPFTKSVLNLYDENGETDSGIPWVSTFSGNMSLKRSVFESFLFDEGFKNWGFENIELGYRLFINGISFKYNSLAINYHLAHAREKNFYDNGIEHSCQYMLKKHGLHAMEELKQFILGQISLQDFERNSGNEKSSWINSAKKNIYNRIIKI